ncbi:probable inactive receptor kinase At5g16590 [Coffea arabica]|uniref:Probable inactive receptor kinase At5g16590 n=1 Tax=Coffea arabica TaxID=13443 RepID=A0ABM4V369_COFAR
MAAENRGSDIAALTWVIRCRIAYGTASGIEYVHSLGSSSSHGNIKSSNIFLKQYYDACVSEYCITRLVSPIPTSDLIGYKAPEVVDSRKVSQKADVYSFGVLLLELLTVFDPELLRHQNFEEQMVQLLNLAISCTSQHPDRRISMHEITVQIKNISGAPVSD